MNNQTALHRAQQRRDFSVPPDYWDNPMDQEATDTCPECFSKMIPGGGCFVCPVCGYSPCG